MAEEPKKEKKDFLIVAELPQVSTRIVEGNDGEEYDLITTAEALKEILENTREIRKVVG